MSKPALVTLHRTEFTFKLRHAPLVEADNGRDIKPNWAVCAIKGENILMILTATGTRRDPTPPIARFNIHGYENLREVPEWLADLLGDLDQW